MAVQATSSMAPSSPLDAQRSPWHSPVPYLFGGLAAMFGLIAFALLVVVYSYWKLSRNFGNGVDVERDVESGDGDSKMESTDDYRLAPILEEKYLVIMAGQEKPTFLATPISSGGTSSGICSCVRNSTAPTEKSSTSEE